MARLSGRCCRRIEMLKIGESGQFCGVFRETSGKDTRLSTVSRTRVRYRLRLSRIENQTNGKPSQDNRSAMETGKYSPNPQIEVCLSQWRYFSKYLCLVQIWDAPNGGQYAIKCPNCGETGRWL